MRRRPKRRWLSTSTPAPVSYTHLAGAVIIPHDFPGRLRTGNNLVFAIFSLIISISLIHILGVVHRHGAGVRIGSLGIFVLIVYNIAQCVATVHKAQTVEAIDVLGNLIAFQNDCKLFRAALALSLIHILAPCLNLLSIRNVHYAGHPVDHHHWYQ